MEYTPFQKKVLGLHGLTTVIYRRMYKDKHELGYASKGGTKYEINIASDAPSKDVQQVVLLHEYGHLYFGHCDKVDNGKEFMAIEQLCKKLNRSYKMAMAYYGGPHSFLNIAMDIQINSELLCARDLKIMKNIGFELCTPEGFGIEVSLDNDFRDYYEPLIKRIPDDYVRHEKLPKFLQDLIEMLSSFDESISPTIRESIADEDYMDGNSKSTDDDIVKKSTVAAEANLTRGKGNSEKADSQLNIQEDMEPSIRKLLLDIVGTSKSLMPNIMKAHNRGTRRDPSGILHSMNKVIRKVNKKKLGILVDVSGSMNTQPLIQAISTVKHVAPNLDPSSVVCTWNTKKVEEWTVNKMPDVFHNNGGTDLSAGLTYLESLGCKAIIVYSDMETNLTKMVEAAKNLKADLYTVQVCESKDPAYGVNRELFEYFGLNKKIIRVLDINMHY